MMDPFTGLAAASTAVKQIDESLGIIGKLVSKLKGQPDLVALKFSEALDEIRKTWDVMDEVITEYLALGIDHDALKTGSKTLLKIQGRGLSVQVRDGRGHCGDIWDIYKKYLDGWVVKALKSDDDYRAIRGVFEQFHSADIDVFQTMEVVAEQLQTEAKKVLELIIEGQEGQAKTRILAAYKQLTPLQIELSESMEKLIALKTQFIRISGAV